MSRQRTRVARLSGLFVGLILATISWTVRGASLDLAGYQREDGAITTHYQGDFVDPYFAMKALLSARALGLDIAVPARRWVDWMLDRPTTDGLFGRYCIVGDSVWKQCKEADADDSLLALWLELLYLSAPDKELPAAWYKSAERSQAALARLYDAHLGAYVISPTRQVALLMDNCEVVAALRAVAKKKASWGDAAGARRLRLQADSTELSLRRLFTPKSNGLLRHTSESEGSEAFYPHVVAQLYPLLDGLPSLLKKPAIGYREWMRRYRDDWLALNVDAYPWGLVALVAFRQGDVNTATCWVRKAEPLRHGARWNVLEDALWQGLVTHINSGTPCSLR